MVRDPKKTKYAKFRRGTIELLAEKFGIDEKHTRQLAGRLSGSRKVSKKYAKLLTAQFAKIGIIVDQDYWEKKERGAIRKEIRAWYKGETKDD